MRSKIELMELHQNQNYEACEHLFKKQEAVEKIEARVRRLEDRDRFGCDDELRRRVSKSQREMGNGGEKEQLGEKLDEVHAELSRKIKKLEEEISRKKESTLHSSKANFYSLEGKDSNIAIENVVERK